MAARTFPHLEMGVEECVRIQDWGGGCVCVCGFFPQ